MKTATRLYFGPLYAGAVALALASAGCGASAPTPELMTARNVYSQARSSEASQLNPRGVHEAHKALSAAEKAHDDDAGSAAERHYSYIATRKSELAIAQASEALAQKEQQRAEQDYKAGLERRSEQMAQESSQYSQQLTQTQTQLQASGEELRANEQKVAELKAAADRAQAQLRQMEAIREEEGRLIISLSGGVLFETAGAQLSGRAQTQLDTVAQALAAYPDRNIVIKGHTDATGSDATNQDLSQRRADAVRSYLENRGVPAEHLRAVGRGESEPIASNENAEGRANNRRVEVIVEPAQQQRTSSAPQATPDEAGASTPPGENRAATPPDARPRTSNRQK